MALVSRNLDPIRFSLQNDPTKPTIVLFTVASATELNAFRARQTNTFKARPDGTLVVSPEQTAKNLEAGEAFAISRIVGVEEFDVMGDDGQLKALTWPQDQKRIVEELQKQTAAWTLFKRIVDQYHGANDGDMLAAIYAPEAGDQPGN